MRYKILFFLFLCATTVLCQTYSHALMDDDAVYRLHVDGAYEGVILLYSSNDTNVVIAQYEHNPDKDLYVTLDVVDSVSIGNWLRVIPRWNDGDTLALEDGYIRLSPYIIVWPRHPSAIYLYNSPSYSSQHYLVNSTQNYLSVLKYSKGWVYTSFKDHLGYQQEGWITPESQCPLTFTTCN